MRLGQLARKLKIEPTKIITFLATENILIDNSPNVKIENEALEMVLDHFEIDIEECADNTVETLEESISSDRTSDQESKISNSEETLEIKEEVLIEIIEEELEAIEVLEVDTTEPKLEDSSSENSFTETDGVIRAPKIQLEGIKIVGKIELPKSKTKPLPDDIIEEKATVSSVEPKQKETSTPYIHPNKKSRVVTPKITIVPDRKRKKQEEKKD